jgi:hypothetical protein
VALARFYGLGEGLPVYSWRPADFEETDGPEVVAVTLSPLAGCR